LHGESDSKHLAGGPLIGVLAALASRRWRGMLRGARATWFDKLTTNGFDKLTTNGGGPLPPGGVLAGR
jgi:hypothetical protein